MTVVIIAVLVFAATLGGGYFALKFKDKLHLIVGFSAGAVLGIAFIDLLPEASSLIGDTGLTAKIALGAALLYMVIDRIFFNHAHAHTHGHDANHDHLESGNEDTDHNQDYDEHHRGQKNEQRGRAIIRAGSLVFHSFLDGLAIGFSFQVSAATGIIVAVAVLAHDFADGINTVAAILKGNKNEVGNEVGNNAGNNEAGNKSAKIWLIADALAPVIGIIVGSIVVVREFALGIILSIFTGFFVYIALADMIPESFHAHPKKWTTIATILGAVFILLVIHLAE